MRRSGNALSSALALTVLASGAVGCDSTSDGALPSDTRSASTSAAPSGASAPSTESAGLKLVRERYGDCLAKLHAKVTDDRADHVTFQTKSGPLRINIVASSNGKTYTPAATVHDINVLDTVGC